MSSVGIIILLFTLTFMILPIVFGKKLRVFLNKYYLIVSVFAIFCLLYFFIDRYLYNIVEFIQKHDSVSEIRLSQLKSKLLLLDMCPLMAFMLPIFSIFKKTRNFALILCPISIIGSCITIFGQIIWTPESEVPMYRFAEFFFVGIWPNRMYFMMHFLTLILAIIILIINYRYNWHHIIFTLLFYFLWIFYVEIMVLSLDIKANASGLVAYDWMNQNGQYYKMYLIWPLPFPVIAVFWYFIILFVNALIIIIKNICTKKLSVEELKQIYYQPNVNYIELFKQIKLRH